jgi:predicted DsbA family dithiol-disulfide isomerase
VFFDYACPYCLRAHETLLALLPEFPGVEPIWRPCEAHPRPERYGPHSDLCIQGMFFAQEAGTDLWAYHTRMYDLCLRRRVNIEDIGALAANAGDLLDADTFRGALRTGKYRSALRAANDYAYKKSGVWVVPAYRMNGRRLDAVENVGVTEAQLRKFLEGPV